MTLSSSDEQLVRLTAAIVLGEWKEVARVRRAAADEQIDVRWREAVLQTHLFAGFPRLIAALEVLDQAGGLGQAEASELEPAQRNGREFDSETRRAEDWKQRGTELFDTIYASGAATVRGRLTELHTDFANWVAEHAYGRVLSRPGLSADRRELLAVVALIASRQDRQLASHARGAVRCGATPEDLLALLPLIEDLLPADVIERSREILLRFGKSD